jgi:hypothetical protein
MDLEGASRSTPRSETAARAQADVSSPSKRRAVIELVVTYALILSVIWTPRPWQRYLWWVAAGAVIVITAASAETLRILRPRTTACLRAMWVPGVAAALAAAAVVVALRLHTLRQFHNPIEVVTQFWAYFLWTFLQQFLLQGFFYLRFRRILTSPGAAALTAAGIFAIAHLPNPILTPITFVWGLAACWLFEHYRELYPLGLAHAILGITIAVTIPGTVDRNMRVGYGYLAYGHRFGHQHKHMQSPQP